MASVKKTGLKEKLEARCLLQVVPSFLESVRMRAQTVSKRGCGKTCRYVKYFMAKWPNSLDQHTNASEKGIL